MQSKLTKTPLHTLLGGSDDEIDTGADFGRQPSLDRLMERIDGAIREGYKRIKLKAMPGWDLEMLQAVRSTFPKFTATPATRWMICRCLKRSISWAWQ